MSMAPQTARAHLLEAGLVALVLVSVGCDDLDRGPSPEQARTVGPAPASPTTARQRGGNRPADESGRPAPARSGVSLRPGQSGSHGSTGGESRSDQSTGDGQSQPTNREQVDWKPAVLRVITNFSKAEVKVNGMDYPEYAKGTDGQSGMVLPAGGPYEVVVEYDGNKKVYEIGLDPYKIRYLVVDLSGYKGGAVASSSTSSTSIGSTSGQTKGQGRVTVYSKPKGRIFVGGQPKKQKTPGTVDVPAGRHDIQVKFGNGQMSESKTVRVRRGSRIKLFFRKRD